MDIIGKLRQTVYYCLNQPLPQGAGFNDNYGVLLTCRGYLRKYNGNRSLSVGEISAESTYKLTIRYQQAVAANLAVSNKFIINNEWYTVSSWTKFDEINQYYEFVLNKTESVAAGSIDLQPIVLDGLLPLYLSTVPGAFSVTDSTLVGKMVLAVARSGIIYNQVAGAVGDYQFSFSNGTLLFNTAFNSGEIVYVLYKT